MSRKSIFVLRIGLALVFLANALTAWLAPQEFKDLVEGSFIGGLLPNIPTATFVTLSLINDSLLFLILFFNWKSIIKWACLWASIYIVFVMIVIAEPFGILEHAGFLAMAFALYLEYKNRT